MKHVFSVTSNLTFSLVRRIVKVNALSASDCVLLLLRGYKIPVEMERTYAHRVETTYNVDVDNGRVFAGARFWRTQKNIGEFDRLVDAEVGGEDFVFYTSVCANDICSLMVTKPNCKGFYMIEDGLSSYRDFNPQTFTGIRYWVYRLLLKPLWPRIFEVKNHFIEDGHPKYLGCIASSDRGFPLHRDKLQVVGNPFEPIDLDFVPDAVLSIDPLYESLTESQVDVLYGRLADFMKPKGYRQVAYKLHPRFNVASNRRHKEFFLGELNMYFPGAKEIAPSVVLENMLSSCHADFYSNDSSVAIYASLSGTKCYSLMPLLKGTPAYRENSFMRECTIPIEI